MYKILILFFSFSTLLVFGQSKMEYLKRNRFDLNDKKFEFPQKDFNIIGFGAYHGSAKTEDVEIAILKSLIKDNLIKYYLPETDYSTAYFFNKYLKNGDTILLKDLVIQNGIRVKQERTIEVYHKWQHLKEINDLSPENQKIEVLGIDYQVNYKYTARHILELMDESVNTSMITQEIKNMVQTDTTSYALGDLSYAYAVLKKFVNDYEENKDNYINLVRDTISLHHIIRNLKVSFEKKPEREKTIYENYLMLGSIYDFHSNSQFLRIGFSHIEKSREGKDGYPYFFTRLIENNIYPKEKIISIIGYLTKSEVVWNELYDDFGKYTGFTVEGGFGIGDYEKEYFRGIENLKYAKTSDKTLFRLNENNSPYFIQEPDLIEIVMTDETSNGEAVKGMSTLDFLDYAVLISDSKASTPIFEMK